MEAHIKTNKGTIKLKLFYEYTPITVSNFTNLAKRGYYDNLSFHRVIDDFIVQGGGYDAKFIAKELGHNIINESGNGLKNEVGTIAMAKESRPHTANRQFFFNLADNTTLDPGRKWGYAVFGSIIEGEEVLEAIGKVPTDFNESLAWNDVPVKPVILIKATLLPTD